VTTGNCITNVLSNYKCLIHLDRLSITFRHWSGSTFQDVRNPDYITSEQVYNNITLMYDNSPGPGAFYHSYKVYYKGIPVGRLHTATKLKKHELQFDFAKEVFYSFYSGYWYEVYLALMSELNIMYNNIMYVEISVDTDKNLVEQFSSYYRNTINNKLRLSDSYRMRKNSTVHVMNNGSSFVIGGSENEVVIYDKALHAEDFIRNYFLNNGLNGKKVTRIESRLTWNYIRYLRNKKQLAIDVETLLDPRKLVTIFQISTNHKITFRDMMSKSFDGNRNAQYQDVSVTDDLQLESAEIGKLNDKMCITHYKTDSADENILRQNYYRFLETGYRAYLRNFKSSADVAGLDNNQVISLVAKFNLRYKGNRTIRIIERMEYALKKLSKRPPPELNELFYAILLKLKWNLLGMF
jgi:hypothetical protein